MGLPRLANLSTIPSSNVLPLPRRRHIFNEKGKIDSIIWVRTLDMTIDIYEFTNVGKVRDHNEDTDIRWIANVTRALYAHSCGW